MPQTSPTKLELDHTPPYSDDEEYIGNKKAKQLTASTPIHKGTKPKHKGVTFNINEIINHPGAFTVPATNIIAAPSLQGQAQLNCYLTCARQRLQNMAQPAPPHLQGADPALIAILNRMENKDSTCKKFLMFPKADFDGASKHTHLCKEVFKSSNGSTTGGGARDISNFGRNNEHDRLYESSASGSHQGRSQSPAHQRISKVTPCWTDQGDSTDIRCQQTKSRATQIYLKKHEVGTHPPYVLDPGDSDKIIFNFVQSVVQQAQQHMFQQLKQCMQQAYTGLTLGMPVRAKEYSEQFKKNNNTLVLTETKRLHMDNNHSEWEYEEDSTSGGAQLPPSPPPPSPDPDSTTPKAIQPSTNSFGGARHKTGLPTRAIRSTAVISGHPAGSETDGEYEDYFNPRIFSRSRLIATSPAFAAAVNLHRPSVPQPIETICRRPWDSHLHGRNTRSQEALRRRAQIKVAKRYPNYKD